MSLGAVQAIITSASQKSLTFGNVPFYHKLGWVWFDIDGFHCNPEVIHFFHQIFLPPAGPVTGYGYKLMKGVVGDVYTVHTKLKDDPCSVAGNVLSAYSGKIPGLAALGVAGDLAGVASVTKIGTNARLKIR